MINDFSYRYPRSFFALCFLALLITMGAALCLGAFPVSADDVRQALVCRLGGDCALNDASQTVINEIRLPRIILAAVVGGALSCAGATYQGMFKNPLVSPDILGVSAGAGLGAALAIFFDLPMVMIELFAFAGGLTAVIIVSSIAAKSRGQDPVLVLVLAGIAVGSMLGAGISLLKILADPLTQLPSITFWLLGSLTAVGPDELGQLLPIVFLGLLPLFLLRWRLNLLALPEDEARSLGVSIERTRWILIVFTTITTASTVAVTGIIGWVGLLVPHMARMLVGANFIRLLPTSFFLGAIFLLLTDTLARTVASIELPLGIITSACGAPFFLYLLSKGPKK